MAPRQSLTIAPTLTLKAGRFLAEVATIQEASKAYNAYRDRMMVEEDWGADEMPNGVILREGVVVARVSYNGKVWGPAKWTPEAKPLCESQY